MQNAQQQVNQSAADTLHFPPAACADVPVIAQFPEDTRLITMAGILPVQCLTPGQIIMNSDGTHRKVLSVRSGVEQRAVITSRRLAPALKRTRFPAQHDRIGEQSDTLYELVLDIVRELPNCRPTAVDPSAQPATEWHETRNIFAA